MTRSALIAIFIAASGVASTALSAQAPAAQAPNSQAPATIPNPENMKPLVIQSAMVGVVGCVTADGSNWVLTNATDILAKEEAVVDLTPDKAKDAAAGKMRYRLIGLMEAFNVVGRKGQRVLAKGLLTEDPKEKRINMTSLIPLGPCSN